MIAKTRIEGSPSAVQSAGSSNDQVSQLKHKSLCARCRREFSVFDGGPNHPDTGMTFTCGIKVENDQAGQTVTSCGYFAESVPVTDSERCCSCPAVRICQVIVPSGSWNPFGSAVTKPCPGVLR